MRIPIMQTVPLLQCDKFQVFVDCPQGPTKAIEVQASDTISKIYQEIKPKQAATGNKFYLVYDGKSLQSHDTISGCGIGPHSALELMAQLHGGVKQVSKLFSSMLAMQITSIKL